ncbi:MULTISPECIES: DUF1648 domain-containing protein [Streptomyces]|uniref:DUF1648 domain-containing protein n=1 Tax=Streptomyces flavovirens TaxID=52258 RepID=A0ABV8N0K2_9ACTN|nr:DUF1648 domain-containing protein [Streptomyces sp. MBT51]MBK3595908.1 DUF1648 domain-containing protein [Streptomyces sp. MBT51]
MVFTSPVRLWLLPSAVILAAMGVWGSLRYSHLPERIPKHIGAGKVDAWTGRSVGSAFLLVFVYAAVTLLMAGTAELTLRVTPRDEMPATDAAPFAVAASSSVNRPGSRESARRIARSLLLLNTSVGVSLLIGCGILWRSTSDPEVSAWLLAAMTVPILAGTVLTVVAALGDRKR